MCIRHHQKLFRYRHHLNLDVEHIVYIDSGPLLSCAHLPIESATIRTNSYFTNRTKNKNDSYESITIKKHASRFTSIAEPWPPASESSSHKHEQRFSSSHPIPISLARNGGETTKVIIDYRVVSHISSISFWVYISSVHCHHSGFIQSVILCHDHYIRVSRGKGRLSLYIVKSLGRCHV